MEFLKRRPAIRILVPAFDHQAVDLRRTVWRAFQEIPIGNVFDDLLGCVALVRLPAIAPNLPQRHPKGPDVRSFGKAALFQILFGHPPDGHPAPVWHTVIIISVAVLHQGEGGYFNHVIVPDEAVPGGQVPMGEIHRGEVLHTVGYLGSYPHEFFVIVKEIIRMGARVPQPEEFVQISVNHKFKNRGHLRIVPVADAEKFDNVGMVEGGNRPDFFLQTGAVSICWVDPHRFDGYLKEGKIRTYPGYGIF